MHVHDLRGWTHDRHHTVDDTPYGGGAGMVMKPEPWGEALDEVLPDGRDAGRHDAVGQPFTQALARELAGREHLVFACGRYEGIDQRVIDEAATRAEVREISLGDYVLNGGEVAALAITEAVVRLLPGFMGNPESLVEESHEDGLLEYPVYTKPASLARARRAAGAALRRPRRDRRVAARAGRAPHRRAPARPRCTRSTPRSTTSRSGRSSRPTRGSCSCSSAPAGCRSSRTTPASGSRPCEESLDDLRAWIGAGPGARRAGRPAAWSARSGPACDGEGGTSAG